MKFLTRIAAIFYVTLALFLCSFILLFVLNRIDFVNIVNLLTLVYYDETLRIIFGASACGVLFLNFLFYRAFTYNPYKGKTIAFDNPAGRVNVSLTAIEDLAKRVIDGIPEVREVKSKIAVSKKGLTIRMTLVLRSESSIPEVTQRVQDLVKAKVQDVIGLEEPVKVSIFIGKIIPDQTREKRKPKKQESPKDQEPNVPFQGYRA